MDETSGHGLVLPLGRALSELLASPSSPSAAGSRKVLRKAQRQFDAAKAQVLLRRQRRGGEAGEQDLVGDKPGGPHAGRAAPLVDALLTVDEFLYQLAQDLPSPSSLLPSLSDKNLSPRTFNVSLIMTPLLEAFSRPELSAKQRKEERRHVSRFCQWLLCHPQGAALCHAYFEHTLQVGADRGMKMQVLELLQDQLKRGVFCKIRDRIVAPTLGHGSAFAVRQGHKQQSRQHSRRVLIEEADLDSLDSPPTSAAPPPVPPLSSVNPLDAAVASLRGLVWCARHDESETHPGAPTRLTLASLDCAVRLCYQISVVVSPSPPSSTLSPRTRDPIVYMPYWCERMAEVNPKNGKTVSSGSAAACANAMEDDNVAHQRQQQGIAGKRWLWKSRSLVPDIINVLLRWVKMSARGAVQQEESAARDSSTVPSLLQMALESCLEELTYWSSVPATGAMRKEQDTEEQNLDQYSCAQNMADVAKIFEDQKNNAPSSSSDDSAIDALAWHFRIYAPFLVNRTRLVHLPTNSGDGQDGSANLLFKVLLGEFEGWFRQCALPSVEPSTVSVGLRCLALQMGRCQAAATALASGDTVAGARAVRAALATHLGMSGCLQGLILHLGHRAETSQQLALALARNLLFGGLQSQSVPQDDNDNACRNAPNEDTLVDTEALLSSLLTMLDQHGDAISRAAVCLIADVAVQRPKHVLPSLFARLERAPSQGELDSVQTPQSLIVDTEEDEGRKNTQNDEAKAAARVKLARRQNTLAVIEEMFRVNSELLDNRVGEPHPQQQLRRRGSVTVPLDKDLTGILVSHMLQRLQDSELVLRTQASALFARLQPARVVPQLCKMICSRDARTRSAAERSLSEVMTSRSNRDPCKTLMTLLDCLRHHGSSNKSEEEEEEEKPNREETFTERAIDRVVRLSPRWVDGLASRRQQSRIFLAVLRKMAAAPSDLTLVKLMSKMARAQATTESPRVFSTILRAVVERMEGQTCLDRDMLFQDTNNQEHIQALLFARTSPLLMLRALPMAAFDLYSSEKGEAFSTDAYALSIDDSDEETSDDDDSSDECGDDDKTSNGDTRADKLAKRDAFRLRCSITRLARELVHRSTRVYEFEQVRKLSAELISRLPLSEFVLPFVASHLEYFVTSLQENAEGRGQQDVDAAFLPRSFQSAGPDVAVVKATVFCACNAVMLRCTLITPRPDVNSQQQQQQHQHQQQQQQQQHQHQQQLKQHQEDVSKACLDLIFRSVAPWLFCILSIPLPRADSSEKVMSGLEKLQRGCIDCLACMCKAKALMDSRSIRTSSMSAATNTRGLIEVIDDGDDDANGGECAPSGGRCNRVEDADPLGMVLDLLCGNIGLAETLHADFRCDSKATGLGREETTQIPFRICMANILISLIRMWQPARAIGADMDGLRINGSKPEAIGVEMDATRQSSIVCIVKDLASFSDQKQIDPTLRGAALQVIFIAIHQLQGDINDSSIPFGRVHALAMAASQDAVSPELRLAGLKLLAILIGKVKGIFSKALAGSAGHTKSVLSQLANIDASEQVRELAERILTSAFV